MLDDAGLGAQRLARDALSLSLTHSLTYSALARLLTSLTEEAHQHGG